MVVTRFAPSPTGFLHIGGVRTAIFNWMFARKMGGQFRLRIEDTDRARSTPEATEAIFEGLQWMGLHWDDEVVFQFARAARHQEIAYALLEKGRAYWCYATPEELEAMRQEARAQGRPPLYDGRWRDRPATEAPPGVAPALRLKASHEGSTVLQDGVQGKVEVSNAQLDDMILLRSDGTPTYMLSVVVDDHDMAVTHVIRGDDHLTNTFRQLQIYQAMDWPAPSFSHIPLIHGADGAKLSKRHGALDVREYEKMGILPEALCNYLMRLGWGHGDMEIFTRTEALSVFSLEGIGRSASRFDSAKLLSLNAHYLRQAPFETLAPALQNLWGRPFSSVEATRLQKGWEGLVVRAKTLLELAEAARVYEEADFSLPEGTAAHKDLLTAYAEGLSCDFEAPALEAYTRAFAAERGLKMGEVAKVLRLAVTGKDVSPPLFEVMAILGERCVSARLRG